MKSRSFLFNKGNIYFNFDKLDFLYIELDLIIEPELARGLGLDRSIPHRTSQESGKSLTLKY